MPVYTDIANQDAHAPSEALLKLGALINACAARCGPPQHSPWSSLFCFLAQGSTPESRSFFSSSSLMPKKDTQSSMQVCSTSENTVLATGSFSPRLGDVPNKRTSTCTLWRSFTLMSWVVQCSLFAIHCATRRFWQHSSQYITNEPCASHITSTNALEIISGFEPRTYSTDRDVSKHKQSRRQRRKCPSQMDKHPTRRQEKNLRQLIDDHQRVTADVAHRERNYKAWQLANERQRNQQVSRALMDEDGRLFPEV